MFEQDVGDVDIVYGVIRDSMAVYNAFASDQHVVESLVNYRINSGDTEPFIPSGAHTPETVEERHNLLDGQHAPIVVAPSRILTGGWSPFYLWQMSEHYRNATVIFIGYQTEGTTGRDLLEVPGDVASVTVSALMAPEKADDPDVEEFAFHDVPTRWLHRVDGFNGHAAANDLPGVRSRY